MCIRIIIVGLGLVVGIVLGYSNNSLSERVGSHNSRPFNVDLPEYENTHLSTHRGDIVKWGDYAGRYRLVYFGYASCPDVCPMELTRLSHLLKRFDIDKEKIQSIFITVDPDRDTVEFLKEYVKHFHPELTGITGSKDEIRKIASAFKVFFDVSEENQRQRLLSG